MENLNNTHDTMTAGDRAYEDVSDMDIMSNIHQMMTPEQYRINEGRMSYDDAYAEWAVHVANRPIEKAAHIEAIQPTTCRKCGSSTAIKAINKDRYTEISKWECEQCGRVEYEKVNR